MLASRGLTIPPCGVPLSVGLSVPLLEVTRLEHVPDEPEEAVVVDLLAEDRQQDRVVDVVERNPAMIPRSTTRLSCLRTRSR